jgi:hypothetical protein
MFILATETIDANYSQFRLIQFRYSFTFFVAITLFSYYEALVAGEAPVAEWLQCWAVSPCGVGSIPRTGNIGTSQALEQGC